MTDQSIYVISNCWDREGATVIGAAIELADAMKIGDRAEHRDGDESAVGWADWEPHDPSPGGVFTRWTRSGLNRDGSAHVSLYQEIVQVPLAGLPDPHPWANPHHDPVADIRGFMERRRQIPVASNPVPPRWATPHYRSDLPHRNRY